jgi:hypothetical protein
MVKAKSVLRGDTESLSEMRRPNPIRDITGEPIDKEWAAEFRGWFGGEGSFKASESGPYGQSVSLGVILGLRADDAPIVKEFQRRLGGTVRIVPYKKGSEKFMARWQVTDSELMPRIVWLLEKSSIAVLSNKQRQFKPWRMLVAMKILRGAYSGSRYTSKEREQRHWAVAEIARLKHWGS